MANKHYEDLFLSAYLVGLLPEEDMAELEEQLTKDEQLKSRLEAMRAINKVVAFEEEIPVTQSMGKDNARTVGFSRSALFAIVASLLAVLFGTLYLLDRDDKPIVETETKLIRRNSVGIRVVPRDTLSDAETGAVDLKFESPQSGFAKYLVRRNGKWKRYPNDKETFRLSRGEQVNYGPISGRKEMVVIMICENETELMSLADKISPLENVTLDMIFDLIEESNTETSVGLWNAR